MLRVTHRAAGGLPLRPLLILVPLALVPLAAGLAPVLASGPHDAPGWASVAVSGAGGYEVSVVAHDLRAPFGIGILRYAADGTYLDGIVYAADEMDSYGAGRGFNVESSSYGGHSTAIVRLTSGGAGDERVAFWLTGAAASWEHVVRAGSGAVTATREGDAAWLLTHRDFGATEAPLGLGYATLEGRVALEAEGHLVGSFPAYTSYWDDDAYGATWREISTTAPGGAPQTCPRNCVLGTLEGPGTYTLDVRAAGAGLAYLPVLFTGADVQLPP